MRNMFQLIICLVMATLSYAGESKLIEGNDPQDRRRILYRA